MARITVEDCIQVVPNRYELVVLAAQRAKDIAAGSPLILDRDNDKDAVVSLREIAEKVVNLDALKEEVIQSYSTVQPLDRIGGKSDISDQIAEDLEEAQHGMEDAGMNNKGAGMSFVEENIEVDD